jgi:5'-methylthioadenosine phosphorylase
VQFADPVCPALSNRLATAADLVGATVHRGGTYICIEGPNFSTRAESNIYRSWGVDIIGMTNIPEARLAREAEICYGTVALATDYDCWHEGHEDVSVEAVIAIIQQNVQMARLIIKQAVQTIAAEWQAVDCQCYEALKFALMTSPQLIPDQTRKDLEPLLGKYLGKAEKA